MIEIPRLPGGQQHIVCGTCPARTILEEKVFCDESKIYKRPKFCPLPSSKNQSGTDAYAMLRDKLKGPKP